MPTYFQRPENALKRANEFIDVGKKQRALDALYDVIKSKKHRTWQKIHEPIMEKYLELCVELRKSHIAKEGLYQYKNICQQVNIKSLEDVVRKYIALAEEKTEGARQESHQVVLDVDDLEMPDTPESLLLKAVSGEDTQDRTDRAILTPWVKFLWESYRQCLDLLRNNSRVEKLYQDIAQQAFKFCLKYTRKTEFRKLCDNLRTHLGHIHKHQHQQTAINLNNPDSQAMHLETRLVQLDSAINMELWQEAFKAVEDIHGLIGLSKKAPKPSLLANYYQKLGLVFWKSGNALFHACTLHRLFQLIREQRKNLSQEDLHKMASRVLCATLAVPIPPSRNAIDTLLEQDESSSDKQRRLATLLMLQSAPTRQALIKDLVKFNIIQYVHPQIHDLYNWLEVEFHPLRLYSKVAPLIEFISQNDDLSQYVPALEDIIVARVLKQISQVFQTIEFARMAALVPFASHFRLERVIVESSRTLELQVRIDHRSKSLSFGTDLVVSQKEDVPEGPYIQSMPSETIRNQLTFMAQALNKAIHIIEPKERQDQREELKAHIVTNYKQTAKKEHMRILTRRQIIEDRKEQLEHINDQREKEEHDLQEEQRKKAYDAEMARLEREAKERERQRKLDEHKEIQKKHAMERLEQLKKTDLGAKVLQNIDEEAFADLDVDDIMQKQVEQLEKEKKELGERLKNQEKKIDHFARAKRVGEIPLLKKQAEIKGIESREFWDQQENEQIEKLTADRELALESQERLMRMKPDKEEFFLRLMDDRQQTHKEKLVDFEKHFKEERKKRLVDRKETRKEERRTKWIKERDEEKQRRADEALIKEREDRERAENEAREAEEDAYREKMAKLEEQAAKQKEREREIEEREEKKRQEDKKRMMEDREVSRPRREGDGESWRRGADREIDRGPDRIPDRGPDKVPDRGPGDREAPWGRDRRDDQERSAWKPQPREGGGWREKEKEREESWNKKDTAVTENNEGPMRESRDRPPPREPPREGGGSWRDRAPREEVGGGGGGGWRDRAAPPREEVGGGGGGGWRDRGAPPREEVGGGGGGGWRDRAAPPREGGGGGGWRDRAAPPQEGGGGGWRDRAPPRDERTPDEGRGGWRDRAPARDGDDRGSSWRSGGGGGGTDRSDDKKDGWRDRAPEKDRDGWRSRDDGGPPPRDSFDRPSAPPRDRDERPSFRDKDDGPPPSRPADKDRKADQPEDDGWTKVKY